jgi:hypothetical protein
MKMILTVLLMTTFALHADKGSIEVCKSYISQVKEFKATMGNDKLAQETLNFYKNKMQVHCGDLSSKTKFERKSFVELMMKDEKTTTAECKQSIEMASKYSETKNQSALIVAAHKENIVDNCGSLVASHVSAYCLYGDE